jgi:TrmH family RNA methyltransferase
LSVITSRDNPHVRRWRALVQDSRERRAKKRAWIEGEHLVQAFLDSGGKVDALVLARSASMKFVGTPVVVSDVVFKSISDVETPTGIGAEISLVEGRNLEKSSSCVFLEGIQDAGNVGTILRSAAAFGVTHAVLGKGCADAWSPKVLRAGMGAHFSLQIEDGADLAEAMKRFGGKLACTVVKGGTPLPRVDLGGRLGWIFGAEGKGVTAELMQKASLKVSIPMPGGSESLNVAAAAAICLYEFSRRASIA